MARILRLQPKRMPGRASPWRILVPPYLSDTGNRQERFFETRDKAKTFANSLVTKSENLGTLATSLSAAQIADAARVYHELYEKFPGVTLMEVFRVYADDHKENTKTVSFGTIYDELELKLAGRSKKHRDAHEQTRKKFAYLEAKLLTEIKPADLKPTLDEMPGSMRNATMRNLKTVFNLGIKREYLRYGGDPINRLDWAEVETAEVEVFPVDAVRKILLHALEHDLPMLPFFVFGFLGGIRPDGELQKLTWDYVHLTEKKPEVEIPPTVSKTKRRGAPIRSNSFAAITTQHAN